MTNDKLMKKFKYVKQASDHYVFILTMGADEKNGKMTAAVIHY
jgi:hypothetical protein